MAFILVLKTFLEGFHDFFKITQRFYLGHLFGGQMLFGHFAQPISRDLVFILAENIGEIIQPAKDMGKDLVKFIEITFVFNERRPCEIIKPVKAVIGDVFLEAFKQGQIFPYCYRKFGRAKLFEKRLKHYSASSSGNDGSGSVGERPLLLHLKTTN